MIGSALFRLLISEDTPIAQISEAVRKHVIAHREASHRQFSGEAVLNALRKVDIFLSGWNKDRCSRFHI